MSPIESNAGSREHDQRATALALPGLAIAMLLSSLGTSIANVALPTFVDELHASFHAVQWIVLAYLLAVTTLVVSVGRLGDLFGRRRLLLVGISLFTVASVICGTASGLHALVAGRVGQGLGAAVMMALSLALVGDAVPKERTGRAMGFLGTMSAVGTALGPSLGGLLIAVFGWRSIFFLNLPLGAVAFVLAHRALPIDAPRTRGASFDVAGSILLALTLGSYALSMTVGRGELGRTEIALLVAAGLGLCLFVLSQSRAAAPLVPLALFRDRAISVGFVTSALVTTVAMTTLVVGPFYLARALGLASAAVGLVMTAGPVVAALVGVPAGRAVDRLGARHVSVAGLASMLAGCVAMSTLPTSLGIFGYLLPLVATTGGYACFQAANNTGVISTVDPARRGLVSGLLNLSRNLGLVTGASLMGAVFAAGSRVPEIGVAPPSAIASGMNFAFAVAAALVALALALLLAPGAKSSQPRFAN
jgi:EmrB/QacA subfamily drug resistance transporter